MRDYAESKVSTTMMSFSVDFFMMPKGKTDSGGAPAPVASRQSKKKSIVREFMEDSVPLSRLSLRYNVHRSTLKSWIRKVRGHGHGAMHGQRRRGRRQTNSAMARPKKKEPQTELEKLQAENLRLRAENALLKK